MTCILAELYGQGLAIGIRMGQNGSMVHRIWPKYKKKVNIDKRRVRTKDGMAFGVKKGLLGELSERK